MDPERSGQVISCTFFLMVMKPLTEKQCAELLTSITTLMSEGVVERDFSMASELEEIGVEVEEGEDIPFDLSFGDDTKIKSIW
jgi:hypothetical protein